jgi:hypothetical protein
VCGILSGNGEKSLIHIWVYGGQSPEVGGADWESGSPCEDTGLGLGDLCELTLSEHRELDCSCPCACSP